MINNMIQLCFIPCFDCKFVCCNWCDGCICPLFINMSLGVKLEISKHVLILVLWLNQWNNMLDWYELTCFYVGIIWVMFLHCLGMLRVSLNEFWRLCHSIKKFTSVSRVTGVTRMTPWTSCVVKYRRVLGIWRGDYHGIHASVIFLGHHNVTCWVMGRMNGIILVTGYPSSSQNACFDLLSLVFVGGFVRQLVFGCYLVYFDEYELLN